MVQIGQNEMSKINRFIRSQTGFTLIELMITITVLTILLFIGSSLTRAWIDQSQVNNAISSIQNAISQAKAKAIRNKNNTSFNEAAASVCIYPWQDSLEPKPKTVIKVVYGSCPLDEPDDALQSFELSNITIQQGAASLNCLDFNYLGTLVSDSRCSNISNPTLTIGKNNETATIIIR